MTLRITPFVLERAYEFLRSTPPFNRLKLPEPDDIEFHVILADSHYADCGIGDSGVPAIRVSAKCNGHTATLMATLAHEMVHLHLQDCHEKNDHGPRFKSLAKRVCKHHGFDPKAF